MMFNESKRNLRLTGAANSLIIYSNVNQAIQTYSIIAKTGGSTKIVEVTLSVLVIFTGVLKSGTVPVTSANVEIMTNKIEIIGKTFHVFNCL